MSMHGFIPDQREHDTRGTLISWGLAIAMLLVPLVGMLVLLEAGIHAGEGFVAPEVLGPEPPPPPQPNRDR